MEGNVMGNAGRGVMAAVGTAGSILLFGVPILFGLWAAIWLGPQKGKTSLSAYNLGVWFGPFYVVYLLFQQDVAKSVPAPRFPPPPPLQPPPA